MIKMFIMSQLLIITFFVGAAVGVAGTITVYNNTNILKLVGGFQQQ
ncbi:MAG: hypothetical protein ACO3CQ_02720 [Candidatus Nanopelagicaceae bacterium]|jgi:hypothetical protein